MRETEPTTITQGEQIEWTRAFCEHSATEWTLQYRFRGGGTGLNLNATADGEPFTAEITAVQSAALASGKWKWQAWATNIADPTVIEVLDSGDLAVERGFATSTASVDLRSDAKIMLDTLDAALLASGSADVVEYEITTPAGGRRIKRQSRTDVLAIRKYYAGIVARELAAERTKRGGRLGKTYQARMYDK
jgi:hypothetical protein